LLQDQLEKDVRENEGNEAKSTRNENTLKCGSLTTSQFCIMQLLDFSSIIFKILIYFGYIFTCTPILSPGCDAITVEYLRWGDPEPIAAVVFACLGLMATFFVTAVFIR